VRFVLDYFTRLARDRRTLVATASIAAVGNQDRVVGSTQVKRRNRRDKGQAQDADTLGPKGRWSSLEAPKSSSAVTASPGYQERLQRLDDRCRLQKVSLHPGRNAGQARSLACPAA
jgi:hypothetical protein